MAQIDRPAFKRTIGLEIKQIIYKNTCLIARQSYGKTFRSRLCIKRSGPSQKA